MNGALVPGSFDRFLILDLEPLSQRMRAEIHAIATSRERVVIEFPADVGAALDEIARSFRDVFAEPVDLFEPPFAGPAQCISALSCAGKLPAPPELRADRSPRLQPALHVKAPRSSWETARRAYCCDRGRVARTASARRQAGMVG